MFLYISVVFEATIWWQSWKCSIWQAKVTWRCSEAFRSQSPCLWAQSVEGSSWNILYFIHIHLKTLNSPLPVRCLYFFVCVALLAIVVCLFPPVSTWLDMILLPNFVVSTALWVLWLLELFLICFIMILQFNLHRLILTNVSNASDFIFNLKFQFSTVLTTNSCQTDSVLIVQYVRSR